VASSWILFLSYQDDARSNTHQTRKYTFISHLLLSIEACMSVFSNQISPWSSYSNYDTQILNFYERCIVQVTLGLRRDYVPGGIVATTKISIKLIKLYNVSQWDISDLRSRPNEEGHKQKKVKCTLASRTAHRGSRNTGIALLLTTTLEGGGWSTSRPSRSLPPGKTRYPLCRRLGGHHGRSGRAENLVPTGIRSRNVHPVASRYTD